MTSILDAYPYPWGRPDARRLRKGLVERFFEVAEARNLATAAGLNPYALNANQSPEAFWEDVLNAAAVDGLTRELAQHAYARLPESAPLKSLLSRLLAEPPSADAGIQLRRTRATARLRFRGVLDHNRVVGGRTREFGALDTFLAGGAPRHLLLTGPAGMGKTALLAEWVRRLDARDDVDVVYYFISRAHGTTGYRDCLVSLLTQAGALSHGEPPRAADGDAELEERWVQLLLPGADGLRRRPMVVVIDGVDEAEAAGEPLKHVLLPTVLAADVHIVVSARTMADRDWPHELGLTGARTLAVGVLDEPGVADLLAVAGAPSWAREPDQLATLMQRTGGDPFYLRFLIDALTGPVKTITSPAGLENVPDELTSYLKGIWSDAGGSLTDHARIAVLSYLCLTRGPITAEELAEIDPADGLRLPDVSEVLGQVGRVVVVDPASEGVALAHPRLQEVVAKALLSRRDRAARQAALLAWCDGWDDHRYPYAVMYVAAHRIEAATTSADLAPVAELLADADYQKLRVEELGDAAGLFADLDRLLRPEPGRPTPDATTLVRAALAVGDARSEWSRPEAVFELAAEGKADDAIRRLALLGSPAWLPWQQGARLVLAWALAHTDEDAARELLDSAAQQPSDGSLESLLAGRARHALGDGPEPELRMWFDPFELPPSDRQLAVAVIARTSGQGVTHWQVRGLRDPRDYTPDNESGAYLAEDEAPWLVAYARDQPEEGEAWLESYIEVQAGNPYAMYRNRALWSVLAAVCCLPDARQALRYAVLVMQAAFAPSAVRFTEFARLATVAGSGDTSAVEAARSVARQQAVAIAGLRELGDQWGHHVRRLAAHAEVAAVVLDDRYAARALLDAAMAVPLGYAGYRAPAYLALADTYGVLDDPARRHAALDQALHSAHNIQEPAFCALMTARVTTLTEWWNDPHARAPELVAEFVANPDAARFAPRHHIGDRFRYRNHHDHIPIDAVTNARNPGDWASALGVAPARLLELNPRSDSPTMLLPDPDFAPMVAAWLSARIAASDLARPDRIRLTASLVPIAAADPTALDLVLGRWVCALGPEFDGLAALLGPLAGRSTVEPSGGGQAGVT